MNIGHTHHGLQVGIVDHGGRRQVSILRPAPLHELLLAHEAVLLVRLILPVEKALIHLRYSCEAAKGTPRPINCNGMRRRNGREWLNFTH